MAEFISRSKRVTNITYARSFQSRAMPGASFSFDCDAAGVIDRSTLRPAGLANLEGCLNGALNVIDEGVIQYSNTYTEPAVIRCQCGARVTLYDPFASGCDHCGREYNGAGQLLAPRSQWGEETGESLADIFNSYDPEDF